MRLKNKKEEEEDVAVEQDSMFNHLTIYIPPSFPFLFFQFHSEIEMFPHLQNWVGEKRELSILFLSLHVCVYTKETNGFFSLSLFLQHPYPSEDQKKQLAQDTGLTILQVNNW